MRSRVDKLGVSEPEIRKQSGNQIVIELAGVHDPAQAAAIIGKTAALELYDLETAVTGPSNAAGGVVIAKTKLYDLLSPVQAKAAQGTPEAYYVFADKKLVAGPITSKDFAQKLLEKKQAAKPTEQVTTTAKPTKKGQKATTKTKTVPIAYKLLALPQDMTVITCNSVSSQVCPGLPQQNLGVPTPGVTYSYLFKHVLG